MKQRWILCAGILLLGVPGYLWYNRDDNAQAATEYSNWSPNAAEIRHSLNKPGSVASGEAARLELFCKLFQSRFRQHDPMMAVGLRPLSNNRLKLMCPARMEPVDVDSIALTAWHEAQETFGHPFEIDLFWTFIGTSPVKVGELRLQKDNAKIACITYHYPDTVNMRPPVNSIFRDGPLSMRRGKPRARPVPSFTSFSTLPPPGKTDQGTPAAVHP